MPGSPEAARRGLDGKPLSRPPHKHKSGMLWETQLDLLQAQRDAFIADVNRIQADAELANARAQLRLASGRSLVASTKERNSLP